MNPWLTIVGIGEDGWEGVSPIARRHVEQAQLLVGGERHLAMVPADDTPRIQWSSLMQETLDAVLEKRGSPVVVLATGDPMWYGVGATLCRRVPASEMRILPAPSAFSLVAARLGWPLADTECLTVHGRPLARLRACLAPDARLIVLTTDGTTPATLAALLVEAGYGGSEMSVFSRLQSDQEDMVRSSAAGWSNPTISDLNTIAVDCRADAGATVLARSPGLADDAYEHDGQLTKREIRAATLAALTPLPGQHLWDVGAGCGSIAIEWMRAASGALATAIERQSSRIALIENNALALGVPDLAVVEGEAPAALDGLAAPDAIFLGGGITDPSLAEDCWSALAVGGRLVANAVTFEGESRLFALAENTGGELVKFEISRAAEIGRFRTWEPMKPVTQLRAIKT